MNSGSAAEPRVDFLLPRRLIPVGAAIINGTQYLATRGAGAFSHRVCVCVCVSYVSAGYCVST